MLTIRDFWGQGAMRGIESTAARRAVTEARARWLPILEACVERDEDGVDEYVYAEIRRLRRLLGLPPADPLPGMVERRRQKVRERVRRFREPAGDPRGRLRLDRLIVRHGPELPLPELRVLPAGDRPKSHSGSIYNKCRVHFPQLPGLFGTPGKRR